MNHTYHVITPLARFENLSKLIRLLNPLGIHWHVITDGDLNFRISFEQPWITHYSYQNNAIEFWDRCNLAINWFLDLAPLKPNDRYCIMADDDAYEPDFFKKVDAVEGDLIIVSMERGQRDTPNKPYGIHKLVAAPENMHPCQVAGEQFIASGKILSVFRIPRGTSAGDGHLIENMVKAHPAVYVPEASVWFNYLEPGRWNNVVIPPLRPITPAVV